MSGAKFTRAERRALELMGAGVTGRAWGLRSTDKSGVQTSTLERLKERGFCDFERCQQEFKTTRSVGGRVTGFDMRWEERWRARLTDAGRAEVIALAAEAAS